VRRNQESATVSRAVAASRPGVDSANIEDHAALAGLAESAGGTAEPPAEHIVRPRRGVNLICISNRDRALGAAVPGGGNECGGNVLKALALGALAIAPRRGAADGLALAGAAGVARAMASLRTDLVGAMGQLGRLSVARIDSSIHVKG